MASTAMMIIAYVILNHWMIKYNQMFRAVKKLTHYTRYNELKLRYSD